MEYLWWIERRVDITRLGADWKDNSDEKLFA